MLSLDHLPLVLPQSLRLDAVILDELILIQEIYYYFDPGPVISGEIIVFIIYPWTFSLQKYREILAQIRQFYFGDDEINEQQLAQFIALFSDLNFAHGVDQTAKMHANKSNGKAFYYR